MYSHEKFVRICYMNKGVNLHGAMEGSFNFKTFLSFGKMQECIANIWMGNFKHKLLKKKISCSLSHHNEINQVTLRIPTVRVQLALGLWLDDSLILRTITWLMLIGQSPSRPHLANKVESAVKKKWLLCSCPSAWSEVEHDGTCPDCCWGDH